MKEITPPLLRAHVMATYCGSLKNKAGWLLGYPFPPPPRARGIVGYEISSILFSCGVGGFGSTTAVSGGGTFSGFGGGGDYSLFFFFFFFLVGWWIGGDP